MIHSVGTWGRCLLCRFALPTALPEGSLKPQHSPNWCNRSAVHRDVMDQGGTHWLGLEPQTSKDKDKDKPKRKRFIFWNASLERIENLILRCLLAAIIFAPDLLGVLEGGCLLL